MKLEFFPNPFAGRCSVIVSEADKNLASFNCESEDSARAIAQLFLGSKNLLSAAKLALAFIAQEGGSDYQTYSNIVLQLGEAIDACEVHAEPADAGMVNPYAEKLRIKRSE